MRFLTADSIKDFQPLLLNPCCDCVFSDVYRLGVGDRSCRAFHGRYRCGGFRHGWFLSGRSKHKLNGYHRCKYRSFRDYLLHIVRLHLPDKRLHRQNLKRLRGLRYPAVKLFRNHRDRHCYKQRMILRIWLRLLNKITYIHC